MEQARLFELPPQRVIKKTKADYVDVTANRHGGNEESQKANVTTAPTKEARRNAVYAFIESRKFRGATADEVIAYFGLQANQIAPRMSELKRDGRILRTEQKRKTRLGCDARVFVAKDFYTPF